MTQVRIGKMSENELDEIAEESYQQITAQHPPPAPAPATKPEQPERYLPISSCEVCHHSVFVHGLLFKCDLTGIQIKEDWSFPEWCPLSSRPAGQIPAKFDNSEYLIGETEIDRGVVELKNLLAMGNLCQDQKDCIESLRCILRDASNRPVKQPPAPSADVPKFNSTDILLLAHDEWKRREERKHRDWYVIDEGQLQKIVEWLSGKRYQDYEVDSMLNDIRNNTTEGRWCSGFANGFLTDKKWARDLVDKMQADATNKLRQSQQGGDSR